jgi:hypothetical protein
MMEQDIPGTRLKVRSYDDETLGIDLLNPGIGPTGNQLAPVRPQEIPALIHFLSGYLDDWMRKRKAE